MTYRIFKPAPAWLVLAMEEGTGATPSPEKSSTSRHFFPSKTREERFLGFLLLCFRSLYKHGLSDRQVAEVTTLMCIYTNQGISVSGWNPARLQITEERARVWEDRHNGQAPRWFRDGTSFCWSFSSLDEFFDEWLEIRLGPGTALGQKFMRGDDEWLSEFIKGLPTLKKTLERVRVSFAQHILKVPVTGHWDRTSQMACKAFQEPYPRSAIPWKLGDLDGFTYKALARRWRVSR